MNIQEVLKETLSQECPFVHNARLNALLDVAEGLRYSQNLSIASIGRKLSGEAKVKDKIKKVDRCLGNEHLYKELDILYKGLSYFVLQAIEYAKDKLIVIDLCYLKDDRMIQMLSAQFCTRGMTLPLYQDVFIEGELKNKTKEFLQKLREVIPEGKRRCCMEITKAVRLVLKGLDVIARKVARPTWRSSPSGLEPLSGLPMQQGQGKKVIIVMDAGFHVEWFKEIENYGWGWVCRIRQGKDLKIGDNWLSVKDYIPTVPSVTKDQGNIQLTRVHNYSCRLVTIRKELKGRKQKISRGQFSSKVGNSGYSSASKEPWILATNLSAECYKASDIVTIYSKRMQIEESFRAIKSHQFGLSARYVRTTNVRRWAVLMLIAAIALVSYWVIEVIGYSQGMEKLFQVNTSNERQFSYFTLRKLIIEHHKLDAIPPLLQTLKSAIDMELRYGV